VGGETGGSGVGPLDPEACRRLACDGAVTRVVVTRHRIHQHLHDPGGEAHPATRDPSRTQGLAARLRAAARLLPPTLGGAPTQPLEVGRTSRVVTAAQRAALLVRDGGCAFPGCDRPPAWCEAHHLRHWLHGGPTTWRTWRCCAEPITGRSMRAAGGCTATPTAGWPPPHPTQATGDTVPPPDLQVIPQRGRARRVHGPEQPQPPCRVRAWGPTPTPTAAPGDPIGPVANPNRPVRTTQSAPPAAAWVAQEVTRARRSPGYACSRGQRPGRWWRRPGCGRCIRRRRGSCRPTRGVGVRAQVGGYRALGHVVGGGLVLRSRNGVDVGGWFPELAGLAGALGDHAGVLDGEWSPSTATAGPASGAAGADGQPGRAEAGPGVTYLVFDLVWLDGRLLTGLPYTEWRRLLEELEVAGPAWQTVASFAGAGTALLEATREQGLEGWWPSGCRASTCRAGGPGTGSRPSTTSVRRSWSAALSPTGTR
jgi:hypothetical protein